MDTLIVVWLACVLVNVGIFEQGRHLTASERVACYVAALLGPVITLLAIGARLGR